MKTTKTVPKQTTVTVEAGMLVIRIPMQEPTLSASGKSLTLASTHGNMATSLVIQGKPVTIGVNAYIRA